MLNITCTCIRYCRFWRELTIFQEVATCMMLCKNVPMVAVISHCARYDSPIYISISVTHPFSNLKWHRIRFVSYRSHVTCGTLLEEEPQTLCSLSIIWAFQIADTMLMGWWMLPNQPVSLPPLKYPYHMSPSVSGTRRSRNDPIPCP